MARKRNNKKAVVAKTEEPVVEKTETEQAVTEETKTEEVAPEEVATEEVATEEPSADGEKAAEEEKEVRDDRRLRLLVQVACNAAAVPDAKFFENGKEFKPVTRGQPRSLPVAKPPFTIKMECAGKSLEVTFPEDLTIIWKAKNIVRDIFLSKIYEDHEVHEMSEDYAETELADIEGYAEVQEKFRADKKAKCEKEEKAVDAGNGSDEEKAYKKALLSRKHNLTEGDDIEWPNYEELVESCKKDADDEINESVTGKFNNALGAYNLNFDSFKYESTDNLHKCKVTLKKRIPGKSLKECPDLFSIEHEEEIQPPNYEELLALLDSSPKCIVRLDKRGRPFGANSEYRKQDPRVIIREQVCELVMDKLVEDGIMKEDDDIKAMAIKNRAQLAKKKKTDDRKKQNDKRQSKAGDKRKADTSKTFGRGSRPAKNVFRNTPSQPANQSMYRQTPYMNAQPAMNPMAMQMQYQQQMAAMQQQHMQQMQNMQNMYAQAMRGQQPGYHQPPQQPQQPGRRW